MLCYWIKKGVTFECFEECFLFIGGGRLKRVGGSYFLQLEEEVVGCMLYVLF